MQVNPYLHFNGNCEEAFNFYEKCLGGKIEMMMPYAGSPAEKDAPADWKKKILHAKLLAEGQAIMGSDPPPGWYQKPQGFSVSIGVTDRAKGEQMFRALSEGGEVKMPYQKSFWAEGFGMLVDRFGVPWMVNCEGRED